MIQLLLLQMTNVDIPPSLSVYSDGNVLLADDEEKLSYRGIIYGRFQLSTTDCGLQSSVTCSYELTHFVFDRPMDR